LVAFLTQGEAGIVDDRGQDVVGFVGDTAGQRADAAELLGLERLLAEVVGFGAGKPHVLRGYGGRPPGARGKGGSGRGGPGSRPWGHATIGGLPCDRRLARRRYRPKAPRHFIGSLYPKGR